MTILLPLAISALAEWTVEKNDKYQFYLDTDYSMKIRADGTIDHYIDCDSCDCYPTFKLCVRIFEGMRIDSLQVGIGLPSGALLDKVDFTPFFTSLCDPATVETPESLFVAEHSSFYHDYDMYDIVKLSHTATARLDGNEKNRYFPTGDYPVCTLSFNVADMRDGNVYIKILSNFLDMTGLFDNTSQKKYIPENDYQVHLFKNPGYHSIPDITHDNDNPKAPGIYTIDGRRVPRAVPGNVYIIDGKLALPTHEIER